MIPRMLTRDIEILERNYPDACRHIRAGQLRYEYFTYLCMAKNEKKLNAWQESRKKELENLSAIQDLAFTRWLERQEMSTPWGFSQQQKAYCGGNIIFHSTASHGGFKVQDDWNKKIPVYMRNSNGWYEEDCDWAKVAVVFMKDDKILYEDAAKTLKNWFPGEYMQYFKCKLEISDSLKLREIDFINRTKNDYVVTAALSWADNMVKVHAVKGGRLENGQYASRDEKWFLVPKTEYTMNFIIDQARHQETEPGF